MQDLPVSNDESQVHVATGTTQENRMNSVAQPTMSQVIVSLKHIAQGNDAVERHWALVALHALSPFTGEPIPEMSTPNVRCIICNLHS